LQPEKEKPQPTKNHSMKFNLRIIIIFASLIALSTACKNKNTEDENLAPNVHKVVAEEVIQTSGYSYVRVSEGNTENWIAIVRGEIEKGKTYYYVAGLEMTNFTSKELKRTFPSVYFVDKFSDQPITNKITLADSAKGKRPPIPKEGIKITPAAGGITIAELYGNKDAYAGKTVKIRGEVVKFTADIMNINWVHIQDGTNNEGSFDLTITTKDVVKEGDVITFEGTVTLNKDFGHGYFYKVILENGKLLTQM
jgi:hypothetical protein